MRPVAARTQSAKLAGDLAAGANPRLAATEALPALTASLTDLSSDECTCEPGDAIDYRLGEMGS